MRDPDLTQIDAARHLLIAGPTASGKSALALAVARAQGGTVVNADALQVWSCWRVLTARPSEADLARAPMEAPVLFMIGRVAGLYATAALPLPREVKAAHLRVVGHG